MKTCIIGIFCSLALRLAFARESTAVTPTLPIPPTVLGLDQRGRIFDVTTIELVLATSNMVIAQTRVSGREGTELIALEAKSGVMRWRHPVTNPIHRLCGSELPNPIADGRGAFFLITQHFLEKRTLLDNKLLWRTRL